MKCSPVIPVLLILPAICFLTSCTTKFTLKMKNRIERSDAQLSNVQVYNSDRIVLQRSHRKGEDLRTSGGKVKVKRGKVIEKLVIKKKTPGIIQDIDSTGCSVIFEKGQSNGIRFRLSSLDFRLDTEEGKTPLSPQAVTYEGKEYTILKGEETYLILKKSSRFVKEKNRKYLRGVKVN